MTTNELLREFIEWNNSLEPERNKISKASGNIFLKNHRPEFKNLDIPLVSNAERTVCECKEPDIFESSQMGYGICLNCNKKVEQIDC